MGPRDREGDSWERAEALIKRFLKEEGRPLNPQKIIQRWELLRRDIGLTDKDLSIILGRALFESRLEDVQTLNDLARFITEIDEMLDRWFQQQRSQQLQRLKRRKRKQGRGPDDGDGLIPKGGRDGRI